MELIGATFATIFGSAATVAAPGIAGAATLMPAASGLSALSAFTTGFSVLSTIGSGIVGMGAANAQAKEEMFQSREEFIQGRETSTALKEELARTVSDQAVAFAAGGVNLGSVSVQEAKRQAIDTAEKEISMSDNQALARSLARQRAARAAKAKGAWGLFESVSQGLGQYSRYRLRQAEI